MILAPLGENSISIIYLVFAAVWLYQLNNRKLRKDIYTEISADHLGNDPLNVCII